MWLRRLARVAAALLAVVFVAGALLFALDKGWLGRPAQDWLWLQRSRLAFNQIYSKPTGPFPLEPTPLLVRAVENVAPGAALDVAAGQGRNSLFLAAKGWKVTAFDISSTGLKALESVASRRGLSVTTQVVTAQEFDYGVNRWDLVVLTYAPVGFNDPALLGRIRDGVKPGGLVVSETPVLYEPGRTDRVKGPGDLERGELRSIFDGPFEILSYEEAEGTTEWFGVRCPIARLIARKR